MSSRSRNLVLIIGIPILMLLCLLVFGAYDVIRRGNGFLFIPSFTPSATNTHTATSTYTATVTPTNTPTETQTATATLTPTVTFTPVETATSTPLPTIDLTKIADKIYTEITETQAAFLLMQTPSVTPTLRAEELITGLKMKNEIDGKTLFYIKNKVRSEDLGIWIDLNEVTNKEYNLCVESGSCSEPKSNICLDLPYFGNKEFGDYPVVNITRNQAERYCTWAGMHLMTLDEWYLAAKELPSNGINADRPDAGPRNIEQNDSNILGNVWEWLSREDEFNNDALISGGSWKTALQDIKMMRLGHMGPDQFAEDVGFRCVMNVYSGDPR